MTKFPQLHARAQSIIAENDVDTVEVAFADTQGHLRGKRIPAQHFLARHGREGLRAGRRGVLLELALRAARAPALQPGVGHRRHDRDARPGDAAPDALARRAPRLCMSDCVSEHGHEPIEMDPRHQLRRQVERCQERGYDPVLATEIEFYLTDRGRQAGLRRHPVLLAAEGRRDRARRRATSGA